MSDTVKYSDEKKLLTSDEFIAAAKQNADKNLQIQKDTAQKVYDSTYASLDRQYNEAAAAAGVAKERNLIDADTAYQRQEMKYGAEQEALAAAGLSGSGMNEYRRAQSYQKSREDRQMSYAEYDRALREANYARDQGKLTADITKIQSDADADILYNDTMTSISEKELGYADLERQEIDTAYSGYLAGIEDGSLTLDQIKADSSWEKLSDDQKTAVITASTVKGLKGRIDNGESWGEIVASDAYKDLNYDGKNQVAGYHAQVVASKTKDAEAALGSYLEMANAGWSIDDIVAAATGNGHFDILTESGSWQSVANAVERITNQNATNETLTNIDNAIKDGATLEDIQKMPGYENLDPEVQEQIKEQIEARDEEKEVNIDSVVANLFVPGNEVYSLADLDTVMRAERVPSEMREEVISRWQSESATRALAGIAKDIYSVDVELLAEGLKNGVYGAQKNDVVNAYYDAAVKALDDKDATLGDFVDLLKGVSSLPGAGAKTSKLRKKMEERVYIGSGGAAPKYAENGMPIKYGSQITDKTAVGVLEFLFNGTNNGYIEYENKVFVRNKNGGWFEMVEDLTRGWKPSSNNNPVSTSGSSANGNSSYEMTDVVIPRDSMGFDQTGAGLTIGGKTYHQRTKVNNAIQTELNGAFPNAKEGSVVQKGNVRYALLADGKWYILT